MSNLYPYISQDISYQIDLLYKALLIAVPLWIIDTIVFLGTTERKITIPVLLSRVFQYGYFFSLLYILEMTLLSREVGQVQTISTDPWGTFYYGDQGRAYVIENIMLFIPYGLFSQATAEIYYHTSKKKKLFIKLIPIISSLILSVCLEAIQYLTATGYTELNDVITNILGALIGGFIPFVVSVIISLKSKHRRKKSS